MLSFAWKLYFIIIFAVELRNPHLPHSECFRTLLA
jgi:hypothetical protein